MATIVEPTGVPATIDIASPKNAQPTDSSTEQIVTALKLLKTRIADRAGKMMSAEMSKEPTRFIASTMTIAVTTAMSKLYTPACVPTARAKLSSKVTAKIFW